MEWKPDLEWCQDEQTVQYRSLLRERQEGALRALLVLCRQGDSLSDIKRKIGQHDAYAAAIAAIDRGTETADE